MSWYLAFLIAGLSSPGAQAYAPIQMMVNGLKGLAVLPEGFPDNVRGSVSPMQLTITDEPQNMNPSRIPYFTARIDQTITWDDMDWCLEANNNALRVNQCTGEAAQKFNWIPNGEGSNILQLKDTNMCLNVGSGKQGLNGAPIKLHECDTQVTDSWRFEDPLAQSEEEAQSLSMRHAMMSFMALAVVGVFGLSVGIWRKQRTAAGAARVLREQDGVSMIVPAVMQVNPKSPSFDDYKKSRSAADLKATEEGYKSFKSLNSDGFDGGDSGGGVVGDGTMDLEDQHNSPTLGALRGGIPQVQEKSIESGPGKVYVQPATKSRDAAAGQNYFGRTTGLAEKYIEKMTEEDVKSGKMDCVRAQQMENWFNQRAMHKEKRALGQGVLYGDDKHKPSEGGFNTQDYLKSTASRSKPNEISTSDLNNHMAKIAKTPAARLDGKEWEEVTEGDEEVEETFEMRCPLNSTEVKRITVKNPYTTFAPYQCDFTADSHPDYEVTPKSGTMNRRSGEPVKVIIRYNPTELSETKKATLVFETEDFKKIWKFNGRT